MSASSGKRSAASAQVRMLTARFVMRPKKNAEVMPSKLKAAR